MLQRADSDEIPCIFPCLAGNLEAETGSTATASATTQSCTNGDFPVQCESPRIGGDLCTHFISAICRLDCRDRFEVFVSASENCVSRRRRLAAQQVLLPRTETQRWRQFASFWPMIKSELIKRISSQNPHLYERDIDKIVSVILDEMVEALRRGDRVELRGFGAFSAKVRGARQGRNPRTGAAVAIGNKAVPSFKTGKDMRERLNRETVPSD